MGEERPPLADDQVKKVHYWVSRFLPSHYDREYIADSIIMDSWEKGVQHISKGYIRNKCISAYRKRQKESKRDHDAAYVRRAMADCEPDESQDVDHKQLVEKLVKPLTPYERKLVWYKFFDNQTLEQLAKTVGKRRDIVQVELAAAIYKMKVRAHD